MHPYKNQTPAPHMQNTRRTNTILFVGLQNIIIAYSVPVYEQSITYTVLLRIYKFKFVYINSHVYQILKTAQ